MPTDFRAGAETAHGHSLMHLWVDALDGAIHHHHATGGHVAPRGVAWDWLEPTVDDTANSGATQTGEAHPDVGEHQESTPVGGGVHLLVKIVAILVLATARPVPATALCRTPESRAVRVLLPPPRWTPLAG